MLGLKPSFPWRHKHEHKHNNSYFTAGISTSASTTKDQNAGSLFLVLALKLTLAPAKTENEIPLRYNTSTRMLTTCGYVSPMKTLNPDYLAPAFVLAFVFASLVKTRL